MSGTPEERKALAALSRDQVHALEYVREAVRKGRAHPASAFKDNLKVTGRAHCTAKPATQGGPCNGSWEGCPNREGGKSVALTDFNVMGHGDGPNQFVRVTYCPWCRDEYRKVYPPATRDGGSGIARAAVRLHGIDSAELRERNLDTLATLYGLDTDTREEVGKLLASCAVRANALTERATLVAQAKAMADKLAALNALIDPDSAAVSTDTATDTIDPDPDTDTDTEAIAPEVAPA